MRDFASVHSGIWLPRWVAEVCLALALSPAFAWMSPFTTDDQPYLFRLGYWGGMLVSWFVMMAVVDDLLGRTGTLDAAPPVVRRAAIIGVTAFPMILVVVPATDAFTGFTVTFVRISELYVQIVMVGTGITLMADAALPRRHMELSLPAPLPLRLVPVPDEGVPAIADPAAPTTPAPNRLLQRLQPDMRGPIICLQMEDHYVRVHTASGSALVLMRLGDAVSETAPLPGRQVHRSWWVADEAVERFERTGRTGVVRLSNGTTAPVSQRYLRSVEEHYRAVDSL